MKKKEEKRRGRPPKVRETDCTELTTEVKRMEIALPIDPISALVKRVELIHRVQREVMKPGIDYGLIPGCGTKPTLLKPGAEKLIVLFTLCPKVIQEDIPSPDGHLNVRTKVELYDKAGNFLGDGIGSCSTYESKYRYRQGTRKCPLCGKESIIKGKAEYGGGWLCWAKKDGCGAKFAAGDPAIEGQRTDRVENSDIADQWNTVRKISAKRARVDAVLSVTGVSDVFTQDIEDFRDDEPRDVTPEKKTNVAPPAKTAAPTKRELLLKQIKAQWGNLTRKDASKYNSEFYAKLIGHVGASRTEDLDDRQLDELCAELRAEAGNGK